MNDLPSPMGGQLENFLGNFDNEPGLNVLTLKFEVRSDLSLQDTISPRSITQNVNKSSITVQPPVSGRSGTCLCWQLCILLAAGINSGGPQVGKI